MLFMEQHSSVDHHIFYFPLDLSWVVDRVLNAIDPAYVILVELEIWPNFLIALTKKHIPVILVNARISEKSLKWYRVLSKISKGFFESLTNKENVFCSRTENDTKRLRNLGISYAVFCLKKKSKTTPGGEHAQKS